VNLLLLLLLLSSCAAFTTLSKNNHIFPGFKTRDVLLGTNSARARFSSNGNNKLIQLYARQEEEGDEEQEEEARIKILESRRKTIRSTLRSAESLRNYRLENDMVPEINEETGKPVKSDSKLALTLTAFVVAAGAVTLRVGGRAALATGLGLDFANGNPELKQNMDQILEYASSLGPGTEALLFVLAWTVVKVFCIDAGGIVLALSSGILFGGVLQGAFASALAATIGSSVSYFLAKVDSPVRKKALEIVEEYPSIRGIEKVVREDGLKAVLTLRLAPILPVIPIGAYNYIYGVTNVPYWDFAGGIFLGSLKPYLLDSYLGFFGKELIEGTAGQSDGLQDIILLVVLGVSVLIGVFASQLAGETWESVSEEIEAERRKKEGLSDEEDDDGLMREMFGFEFPEWVVGAQIAIKEADARMEEMVQTEFSARVWNCTEEDPPQFAADPANFQNSPENIGRYKGFDVVAQICDGFVLSPCLLKAYFKYADPLYDEAEDLDLLMKQEKRSTAMKASTVQLESNDMAELTAMAAAATATASATALMKEDTSDTVSEESILKALDIIRTRVGQDLLRIEEDLDKL
jgi:uncharacterized membrane protein YdjX (TVP38/TMEM64 family)